MEHLPEIRRTGDDSKEEILVPLLHTDIHYGQQALGYHTFRDFPGKHGYRTNELELGPDDKTSVLAFLQSWLFFGLLTESFGLPEFQFKHEDFVRRRGASIVVITTEALPRYVWYWQVIRRHRPIDFVLHHMSEVDRCLELVNSMLNQIARLANYSTPSLSGQRWSQANSVLLSIIATAEYVNSARNMTIRDIRELTLRWCFPVLDQAMLDSGWCVAEIESFAEDCGPSTRFYLSTIDRRPLKLYHQKCDRTRGCHALQIDYKSYRTQHSRDCLDSECDEVGVSVTEVAELIQSGQIPLVVSKSQLDGRYCLPELTKYDPAEPNAPRYVAISHVWSDGMGNPWQNRLKTCQMNKIQALVNELYDPALWPVPFWMDTLCIPVYGEYREIRQAAIMAMASIYRSADKVLVLDSSLRQCSSEIPVVEMMLRIRHSPWMTRVWTLQEGRLSRNLVFQFLEKTVSSDLFHDTVKLTNILPSISRVLSGYEISEILSSAPLSYLVKALASYSPDPTMLEYARMPPQDDHLMEELRLTAVENMKESLDAITCRRTWEPVLAKMTEPPTDEDEFEDEFLRAELRNALVCPVITHGVNTIHRIQGWTGHYMNADKGGYLAYSTAELTPSSLFLETCSGFRGRTTSRLEDETICLGTLLRADLREIQRIPPMNWRMKDWFLWFDSTGFAAVLRRFLGLDIRRWVQRCHEERMKILLQQVREFPASVIFWKAPRLRFDGWRWAPYSVMHKSVTYDIWVGGKRGIVKNDGLEVTVRGFKFNRILDSHLNPSRAMILGRHAGVMCLVLHTDDDDGGSNQNTSHPWRQSWKSIRLNCTEQGYSPKAAASWDQYAVNGPVNRLAILIEEGQGILVHEYGEREGVHLVRHVDLVERIKPEARNAMEHTVHIAASWVESDTWCVG